MENTVVIPVNLKLGPESTVLSCGQDQAKHADRGSMEGQVHLVEDGNSNRALLGEMKTLAKRWSRQISDKGLLAFFANGHAADDANAAPGRFSTFMCGPIGHQNSSDHKSRINQVKSMFGSTHNSSSLEGHRQSPQAKKVTPRKTEDHPARWEQVRRKP